MRSLPGCPACSAHWWLLLGYYWGAVPKPPRLVLEMHGTHAGLAGGERSASGLATRPSALGENERVRVRALTSSHAHACAHTRAHSHDHSASDQGLVPWKDQSMGEKWRRAPLRRAAPGPGRGSFPRVGREGGRWPPGAAGCRAGGSPRQPGPLRPWPGGHQARPRDPSPRAGARDHIC